MPNQASECPVRHPSIQSRIKVPAQSGRQGGHDRGGLNRKDLLNGFHGSERPVCSGRRPRELDGVGDLAGRGRLGWEQSPGSVGTPENKAGR